MPPAWLTTASARAFAALGMRRRGAWPGIGPFWIRRRQPAALGLGAAMLRAVEVAPDGMAIVDAELRLVAWNRAYADMHRAPPELFQVGAPLRSLVRWAAANGVYGAVDVDGMVAERMRRLSDPTNGDRFTTAHFDRVLEMRSLRLPDGGMFFTYADATAKARSEEELEAVAVTLERRVVERTEELQGLNMELARAKAEAEDADISKTRFLAAATHDLLQPLNAARLYTTALREQMRKTNLDDLNRLVTNVDLSLNAVEDILGALLEITQLDAGATQPEITAFHIADLLGQLRMEFAPLAHSRGLTLVVLPSSVSVRSDRKLLRRLLQNLIGNALKYTREGRVLVGVRLHAQSVRIEVHDSGIGIPEEKRTLIFREFERLPDAVHAAPGAGLGLSIVERLSRILDHQVVLDSIYGRGSAFAVRVPRVLDLGLPVVASPRPALQRSLRGMTIVAVDNEPDVLSGMETLLRGWDCAILTGTDLDAAEATLAAHDAEPDVIIADYHVGLLDGLAIIEALRQRHGPKPAVLITADRATAIRLRAQQANVRVLNKPVKPAALRSLLSQWQLIALGRGGGEVVEDNALEALVSS